jgi:hypothetical protein
MPHSFVAHPVSRTRILPIPHFEDKRVAEPKIEGVSFRVLILRTVQMGTQRFSFFKIESGRAVPSISGQLKPENQKLSDLVELMKIHSLHSSSDEHGRSCISDQYPSRRTNPVKLKI